MRIRRLLLAGLTCVALCAAGWAAEPAAPGEDNRIQRAREELRAAQAVLAEVTNATEQALWEKRIALADSELKSLQRLIEIEEREKTFTKERRTRADYNLREALVEIETSTNEFQKIVEEKNAEVRRLKTLRTDLEARSEAPEADTDESAKAHAEANARLRSTNAEILARTLERQAGEGRLRLAQEAGRIEAYLAGLDLNPRPTVKLLHQKSLDLDASRKNRDEADAHLKDLEVQRQGIVPAIVLAKERFEHLDQEIAILAGRFGVEKMERVVPEKKAEQAERLSRLRRMLSAAEVEKTVMRETIKHLESQRAAIDDVVAVTQRGQHLFEAEVAFREADFASLEARFMRRVKTPLLIVAGLIVAFVLVSRIVLPLVLARESVFVARRLGGYVLLLLIITVLVSFFLEDLKAIATVMGIVGAAIVIALQELCLSFAGWFAIVGSRKIRLGDRVEIDGHRGDIIDIQILRTTLLEVNNWLGVDEPTGRAIVVPNSFIFKNHVFNYTHVHPYIWGTVQVTMTFESPPQESFELLMKILKEETEEDFRKAAAGGREMERRYGIEHATYAPRIHTVIADSGVTYSLFYVTHYKRVSACRDKLSERILREVDAHPTINFAYPTERHIPTAEAGGFQVTLKK